MAKKINYRDSMNDVVDTVGPVLQSFINNVVREELPDVNVVYDPSLDYISSMKRFRENSSMNNDSLKPIPLFSFNRSVLRWSEDVTPHRRISSSQAHLKNLDDGSLITYTPFFGEFDLNFAYYNNNMEDIEKFEITYLSNEGISGTREFLLRLPDELGDFTYFADYNELESLDVNYEENYFKVLAGTIKIRGMFFTFRSESSIIKEIQVNYRNWIKEVALDNRIEMTTIIKGLL